MLRALRLCCFNRFGSVEYLWKAVWSDTATPSNGPAKLE